MLQNALNQAKLYLKEVVNEGDHVVDATAGNGHDTLFLAKLVGEYGRVTAFDIQQQAIDATRDRLENEQMRQRVQLIHGSHSEMEIHVPDPIKAAVFNLGYLPGADHTITTNSDSTWSAIQAALSLLVVGGRVVIVIYHGHDTGKRERQSVLSNVATLSQEYFQVLHTAFLNQQNCPPELVVIEKKKQPLR